ncbi:MAG: disulfide oxidoreductase [Alphaproteobacteria bacterium]|nr:disulfide oxidoreductase [Alphaproteobacteria bacterium]
MSLTGQPSPRLPGPDRSAPPPIGVLGPTNTGKTHYAIERMLAHRSGMIGLPLRLLAREVYDRIVERRGARDVALITGEEKITPPSPRYWVCTVEAMPLDHEVEFMAVDEIQLAADLERGRVFTSRLLYARGTAETLFLGSETMRPILRSLFSPIRFLSRERFSSLTYAGPKKVTRLPRRSAVVGFSSDTVYAVAELIRRQRGGAAVILGALSPRTRNAQAALYQSGEVDYLVATDAIGMGLNMDIDHVAFASRRKFDGYARRPLRHDELAQIAGRAGRHMREGTFGVTADCPPFEDEAVAAIEEHEFDPVRAVQWRSEQLDFSSVRALSHSLDQPSPRIELKRAPPGEDELAFHRLAAQEEIARIATGGAALSLLWEVCQIPDFRKTAPDAHARLLADIYKQIVSESRIKSDWLEPRLASLDRTDGDIDAISARIAHVRTWTYLSHRSAWLENAAYWQEKARAVEDSLSDALHEKLTQRFVDRRTSVLMKKLKDDEPLLAGVTDDGEVIVEGQFVGRLLGFEFIVDPRARGLDAKRMRAAADQALASVLAVRAAALANATNDELTLRADGALLWRGAQVARLIKGPTPLRPEIVLSGVDAVSPHLRGRIKDRLTSFLASRVEILLGDLIALTHAVNSTDADGLGSLARGVAFRLLENFGAMSRAQFGDELKQLDQNERGKLRKLGVRFGEYTLYMPSLLKPAPARLLTLLWALWSGRNAADFEPPKAGLVSLAADNDLPHAYYYASGYRPSGTRAVRIDMLERLAGQIRSERKDGAYRGGFEASPQMMSLVGCSGEDFESILGSLGYRKQSIRIPVAANGEPAKNDTASEQSPPDSGGPAAEQDISPHDDGATVDPAQSSPDATPADSSTNADCAAPQSAAIAADSAGENESPAAIRAEREVVIWRLAPRKPPRSKHRPVRPERGAGASKTKAGAPGREARPRKFDRPRAGGPPPKPHSIRPQHRKVADPNSPFAVLAGLKDELVKSKTADKKPEKAN